MIDCHGSGAGIVLAETFSRDFTSMSTPKNKSCPVTEIMNKPGICLYSSTMIRQLRMSRVIGQRVAWSRQYAVAFRSSGFASKADTPSEQKSKVTRIISIRPRSLTDLDFTFRRDRSSEIRNSPDTKEEDYGRVGRGNATEIGGHLWRRW